MNNQPDRITLFGREYRLVRAEPPFVEDGDGNHHEILDAIEMIKQDEVWHTNAVGKFIDILLEADGYEI